MQIIVNSQAALNVGIQKTGKEVIFIINEGRLSVVFSPEEFDDFIQEIKFSMGVVLSHSLWASRRITGLRQCCHSFREAMIQKGYIQDGAWSITAEQMDSYMDASAPDLILSFLNAATGWGKEVKSYLSELIDNKVLNQHPEIRKSNRWRMDHIDFKKMTDEEIREGSGSTLFRVTNHSSLQGFTQPVFMSEGQIDVSIEKTGLSLTFDKSDSERIMAELDTSLSVQIEAARKLWQQCRSFEKLFSAFRRSLMSFGLDDDGDFFDEVDVERLNVSFTRLFDALLSARTAKAFEKELSEQFPSGKSSISISFS